MPQSDPTAGRAPCAGPAGYRRARKGDVACDDCCHANWCGGYVGEPARAFCGIANFRRVARGYTCNRAKRAEVTRVEV